MNAFVAELTATAVDTNEKLEEQRKKAFAAIYPTLQEKCRSASESGLFWCSHSVAAADVPELAELYRLEMRMNGGSTYQSAAYFRKELKALGLEKYGVTSKYTDLLCFHHGDDEKVEFKFGWPKDDGSHKRRKLSSNVEAGCPICLETEKEVAALYPCGHLVCLDCCVLAPNNMFVEKPCPVCKAAVVNVVSLFDAKGKEEDKTEDKTGETDGGHGADADGED